MYSFLKIHFKHWLMLLWPLTYFIRTRIFPTSLTSKSFAQSFKDKSIIYVIPKMSVIDILILNKVLKSLGQSRIKSEAKPGSFKSSAVLALKSRSIPFALNQKETFIKEIVNLFKKDSRAYNQELIFCPVSIFWSRAPEREERGFLLKSLFPDDGTGNGLQKLFMLLLHRGEVNVSFGKNIEFYFPQEGTHQEQIPHDENIHEDDDHHENIPEGIDHTHDLAYSFARRVRRQFYIEFAKDRAAFFGPSLYDQEKLNQWVLSSRETRKFLMTCENPEKTQKQIAHYLKEISANYNYVTVSALIGLIDIVWTKVFSGVRVRNFEKIERLAKDGHVVWMPCHRSHFDYILLNYILYTRGFVGPHVAAGINLNFWPIGALLRRGGAFFIRRSFSGNRTYAHAFSEYVNFIMQHSFHMEFFQEGGRSRIGKMLPAKLGLLSICTQSIISRKAENTYFVPVYISYDKVMEDDSYARELKGAKKQKENAFQFLNAIRKVFVNYGYVDLSFGEPLKISDVFSEFINKFADQSGTPFSIDNQIISQFKDLPDETDTRDPKIQSFIKYLGRRINQKICSATTASSTALLSTVLLTQKAPVIETKELKIKTLLLHWIFNHLGQELNWRIATSRNEPWVFENLKILMEQDEEICSTEEVEQLLCDYFETAQRWKLMQSLYQENNHVFVKNFEKELNLWWYRGTIFNVCAIVGFCARIMLTSQRYDFNGFVTKIEFIRNLLKDELFWDESTSCTVLVEESLKIFETLDIINFKDQKITSKFKNKDSKFKHFAPEVCLSFLSELVTPEIELLSVLVATGLHYVKYRRSFERSEVLLKAIEIHESSFKKGSSVISHSYVKVFAPKTFDTLYKGNVFIADEKQKFTVNTQITSSHADLLNIKKWNAFFPNP